MAKMKIALSKILSFTTSSSTTQDPDFSRKSYLLTKDHGLHNLQLCKACNSLDLELLSRGSRLVHLKNCFDLKQTSLKCRLCAYIAQTLLSKKHHGPRTVHNILTGYDTLPENNEPLCLGLRKNYLEVVLGSRGCVAKLEIYSEPGSLGDTLGLPHVPQNATSDLSVALRKEMPVCISDVNLYGVPSILPRRVIDVGGQYMPPRLHISLPKEVGIYATLSHRWGDKVPIRTTRRTLEQYKQGISIFQLPKTFQDAITVVRLLGIKYLWIDALCIIQDDRQDWDNQAPQMGWIYENSFLTIAAHSAKNSMDGFLWRREVPSILKISPSKAQNDLESSFWLTTPPLKEPVISDCVSINSEINQRAWVAQELALAQRLLHIVEGEFLWECSRQECWPERCAYLKFYVSQRAAFQIRYQEPRNYWRYFVERYSTCQMTKDCDKLPAISGIARIWTMKKGNPCHNGYYSGIFDDEDTHCSLLWLVSGDSRFENKIRNANRAPTWSWASVDGRISFTPSPLGGLRDWSLKPAMQIIKFECACGRDSIEHLTCRSCSIRLRAVIAGMLRVGPLEDRKFLDFVPEDGPEKVFILQEGQKNVGWAAFDNFSGDTAKTRFVQMSYFMKHSAFIGFGVLMVEPSPDETGRYVRVGAGYIHDASIFESLIPEVITII